MKYVLTIVTLALTTIVFGQTMTNKTAKQFLQDSWNYIETQDSVSFANLWSLNDSESKKHRRPHSTQEIYDDYNAVSEWLDTALTRKLKIDYVEVEKTTLKNTDTKYWIKAWFKYNDQYYKSYGFYVTYFNNKWTVRDATSTSLTTKQNK